MTTTPPAKKQKTTKKARITLVDDFHMSDCQFEAFIKSAKCNLVPLLGISDQRPVLIQLNGGGMIPLSFGIEDKEQDGKRKVQLAVQIDSKSDHAHLERLRTELGVMVAAQWKTWFPDVTPPSNEVLMSFCNTFVSARKKKKTGDDTWSGVTKAAIDPDECTSGRCKIIDLDTGTTVPFQNLPGMNWHKVIFELRYVFIQATKSYGVTKKLRYILCSSPDDDDAELDPL